MSIQFGRYELLEKLAAGGLRQVFLDEAWLTASTLTLQLEKRRGGAMPLEIKTGR